VSPSNGVDGYLLFSFGQNQILTGVREVGTGGYIVEGDLSRLLELSGLIDPVEGDDPKLSEAGLDLYRAAFVARDEQATKRLLGQALRSQLPVQVIAQELGNSAAVPEEGVISLLALHRVVDADFSIDSARPTFRWLNDLGVVVYSRQKKTVRFVPDDPGAAKAGEVANLSAMISPRTPFSNVARLRRLLRTQSGVVAWADQHFGSRAFEELVDELDPAKVTELRILSGSAPSVVSSKSFKDYERFRDEMKTKGIAVEWRVDGTREWHDRWLIDDSSAYNLPPVNSLFANQYSEILPTKERPPVDEWWKRATPRAD
jgi:hypothetical protein